MRKEIPMKKMIALVMVLIMTAGSAFANPAYSDREIEKRIDEAGNAYIEFYRKGFPNAHSAAEKHTQEGFLHRKQACPV